MSDLIPRDTTKAQLVVKHLYIYSDTGFPRILDKYSGNVVMTVIGDGVYEGEPDHVWEIAKWLIERLRTDVFFGLVHYRYGQLEVLAEYGNR